MVRLAGQFGWADCARGGVQEAVAAMMIAATPKARNSTIVLPTAAERCDHVLVDQPQARRGSVAALAEGEELSSNPLWRVFNGL